MGDADADGKIEVKELNKALRLSDELQKMFNVKYYRSKGDGKGSAPPMPSFFTKQIEKFDIDSDGKISWPEFESYFFPKLEGRMDHISSWAAMWNTFNSMDEDHNGKIQ